jgi:hypothetical protein
VGARMVVKGSSIVGPFLPAIHWAIRQMAGTPVSME